MKDTLYNQINPLVRIEEGSLLKQEDFQKLLNASTFAEGTEALRNTVYGQFIEEADFSEKFEYYLRQEQVRLYRKLYQLAPEKAVIDIYTMRYTYHNLKLLTKAHYTKQNLDEYVIEDGQYSLESLKSAIANQSSTSVKGLLMASILEVTSYLAEYDKPRAIDIIYDRFYMENQRQAAESLKYPELLQEVIAFIDLTNISTVIRGINQKQGENFLNTVISDFGSLNSQELASFADRSLAEFTDYLLSSPYKEVATDLMDSQTGEISSIFIERERDNFLTKLFIPAKVQAFGPLPLLALLNAKDIEVKNIQLILVGLKNNFPAEAIAERMRKNYGL